MEPPSSLNASRKKALFQALAAAPQRLVDRFRRGGQAASQDGQGEKNGSAPRSSRTIARPSNRAAYRLGRRRNLRPSPTRNCPNRNRQPATRPEERLGASFLGGLKAPASTGLSRRPLPLVPTLFGG